MCSPAAAAPHEDKEHMRSLVESLPRLGELFELHRKVGEGTFSSVFVGSLRADRRPRRLYAIKHLVPTAHPARIEHELRCLRDIGGQDHVIGVELCLRRLDTVVFVMPYIPHRKFSEYVVGMCAEETRRYMRALLLALRRVHHFGVIHRDVKPSNFLYDRDNQRYLLVDFGLAQRVTHISDKYGGGAVCVEASGGRPVVSQGAGPGVNAPRKRPAEEALSSRSPASKRAALSPAARAACSAAAAAAARLAPLAHLQADHPKLHHPQRKNATAAERLKLLAARRRMVWARAGGGQEAPLDYSARARLVPGAGEGAGAACACAGRASVCARCLARPAGRAPRAGTQGFRPPEVLLKYQHQTTAVDMWACGVILLCVLSGRYPFFRAPDDPTALAEFVSLFGSRDLQCAAHRLGRQLTCSAQRRAVCVRRLCARLRSRALGLAPPGPPGAPCCPHCRLPQPECVCCVDPAPSAPTAEWCGFPDSAFDLLLRLLDLNPHTRITAHDALRHPFLAGPLETSTAT